MPSTKQSYEYSSPGHLPGLEKNQGPNACAPVYVPVNYCDQPRYENDEQGWTYVSKKVPTKKRSWRGGKKERRVHVVDA